MASGSRPRLAAAAVVAVFLVAELGIVTWCTLLPLLGQLRKLARWSGWEELYHVGTSTLVSVRGMTRGPKGARLLCSMLAVWLASWLGLVMLRHLPAHKQPCSLPRDHAPLQ